MERSQREGGRERERDTHSSREGHYRHHEEDHATYDHQEVDIADLEDRDH